MHSVILWIPAGASCATSVVLLSPYDASGSTPPLPSPVLLYLGGGIPGGEQCVILALLASFATLFHEPFGGSFDAETPVDRYHAPHEIGHAAVVTLVVPSGRRSVDTTLIARPYSGAASARSTKRGRWRFLCRLGGSHQSEAFQLLPGHDPAGSCLKNAHDREIRFVFAFVICSPGDTGGTRGRDVRSGRSSDPPGEVSVTGW